MRTLFVVLSALTLALGGGASFDWFSRAGGLSKAFEQPLTSLSAALLIAALTSLNLLLRWLRWVFLLRRFHVRMPTRETFQVFFATLPAILTPLYVGELIRGILVARRHPHITPVIAWVWLVERSSDLAAVLCVWGIVSGQLSLLLLGVAMLIGAPLLLASFTLRLPGVQKLHTAHLSKTLIVAGCSISSVAAWSVPIVGAFIGLRMFVPVDFELTCSAFVESTLMGAASGIPGGAGIMGSAMIGRLVEGGIDLRVATASVAVLRLSTDWYAVALGVASMAIFRNSLAQLLTRPRGDQQHFDELSSTYADGIPEHIRSRLVTRKIAAIVSHLPETAGERTLSGLDLGCGQGWYAAELARRGYRITGIDLSPGQIVQAEKHCRSTNSRVALATFDGTRIPFDDASFDFVYSINVLHHVIRPEAREQLLAEVLRVLKPDGVFLLHEMNVENALFRLYMSYVFPLIKRIDEGTELWIRPTRLPRIAGGAWSSEVAYFTFLPEFLPYILHRVLEPLERRLELSSLRRYSAHYMASLRRT
jgi:ubiquinone/menaquinone biosynthesis C-methylase UbiE/uncharacterized membrane protein YbhN (UPF0104 family)